MTDIKELLLNAGLKCTAQRVSIIKTLEKSGLPMTAEEIFQKTKNISLSTIYRALDLFCENGITERESICNSAELYYRLKTNTHCHYAICLGCGKLSRIDVCPVHEVGVDDFVVTGHKLELYGYCKKCGAKSDAEI